LATVGEIGERALIEIMLANMTPMPGMPVPFWDDVTAISLGDGRATVINTDMLVWETDVPRGMTAFQAARKAVVMNFSDLAAKGVQPRAFLASLGLPRTLGATVVEQMARGFEAGAREHEAYVLGGDTNEASEIIINGIALGVADEERLMKRSGARPGDILATTGLFGDTTAAFKILLEGYGAPEALQGPLLESVYHPKTRVKEGVALATSGAISASIDSSDGLAMSLYDLSRSSGLGFRLTRLPTSPLAEAFAELSRLRPGDLALYGGEEYELVFTVKPDKLDAAREALRSTGCSLYELGEATQSRGLVLVEDEDEKQIERRGWEHFRPEG
jgi:thiamine-monophosphate kinase